MASTSLQRLAALLAGAGLTPYAAGRPTTSPIYDVQYRAIVVAATFHLHATPDRFSAGRRRMRTRRLKLFQFVATRPWLADVVMRWAAHRTPSLPIRDDLRNGFMTDSVFDAVVEILVMLGALKQEGDHTIEGPRPEVLMALHSPVTDATLFTSEMTVLKALSGITITRAMEEGW